MKVTRILAVMVLLALVAGVASAQEITRLSWNSCATYVQNLNYTDPGAIGGHTKLVYSVTNANGVGQEYWGHDTSLLVTPPPLADCWRFDDAGCQAGYGLILFSQFAKTCPAFQGTAPLAITNWGYDPGVKNMIIRIANTFNGIPADPALRYTVWVIDFDMTYATAGPSNPGLGTCGGAEQAVAFYPQTPTEFLHGDGHLSYSMGNEQGATWNGATPAHNTSWSSVKGLYR